MNNITRADLDEMRKSASRIANLAERFQDEYSAMYRVIHDDLTRSWVGADSDSFVENVDSVRYRFDYMHDTMLDYEKCILDAVARYEEEIRRMEEQARNIEF